MQPYAHALTSARLGRRNWLDDLPIHEFMDIAKHACPDLRHRIVLHNVDLGPELAAMAFPDHPDARSVALLHVRQDLRRSPTVADWFDCCDLDRLPRLRANAATGRRVVKDAANYLKLADEAPVQDIWSFLTLPSRIADNVGDRANSLLMNGVGPILARAIFGPPRKVPRRGGGETIFDASWVCEGMIVAATGHIPSLSRILDCFDERAL